MSENLPKNSKLLVVSDTGMYWDGKEWCAFAPVVVELEYMLSVFSAITWIGFERPDQKNNKAYKKVDTTNIKMHALKRVGGIQLINKIEILKHYPNMWRLINMQIKEHQFIHVRAPSNPAIITMLLSKRYMDKKFWFKYAGSWVDKTSKSYNWQRERLKKLKLNSVISVNGEWQDNILNIIALDNPCLSENDRKTGLEIISKKTLEKPIHICFVGGLNENKGVSLIIEAFNNISDLNLGTLHIVGDGYLKQELIKNAKNIDVKFYGQIPKEEVIEVYKKSHFIILSSKSEGFPKVISEAMNFGCVPITSNVSSISQVVTSENGFLLETISSEEIERIIRTQFNLTEEKYKNMIALNYHKAQRFTYNKYINKMVHTIFKIKTQ